MFVYLNIMPGSLTRALKVRKGVLNHGSAVLEFKLDQLTSNTERGALNFTVKCLESASVDTLTRALNLG